METTQRTLKKRKSIPFRFGEAHKEYIRKCSYNTFNILEGSVRAGKTIDNIYAFAHELRTTPDKIHLATGSTVGNAKLNIGDCNGFGLEYIFRGQCKWVKYKDNDALRICGPYTGNKEKIVIFAGGSKADSYKKIRGNSYGMWIATEINLHHDSFIKEAFNRQLAAKNRKVFWDMNPDNPRAPIYKDYIDLYAKRAKEGTLLGGYNYHHFTIFENKNIPKDRLDEIVSQYDPGSIWYKRDIEGERSIAEGLVYPMFSKENIVKEHGTAGEWYLSIDYGTLNPTAFELWRVSDQTATMEKEYYYNGRETKKQKTDEEYYSDLEDFIGKTPVRRIIIDPSAASFKATIRSHGKYHTADANNSVLDGIRTTGTLIAEKKLKVHESCQNTLEEFSLYRWDETKDTDTVIKENDHAMDAMRYFCMAEKNKINQKPYKPIYMR